MKVVKYETRLDENGFVKLDTVFSKYVPEIENHFVDPEEVYKLCRILKWDSYSEEHIFLLCLDGRKRLRGFFEIGIGNDRECVVDERGIAQKALLSNATAIILIHNHPSGDPTPSEEDRVVSNELKELGDLLEILFVDSIILGNGVYASFRESELL